ncbi:Molybdopterin molybdenumtransferase [Gammaproteobacteria bacterium]
MHCCDHSHQDLTTLEDALERLLPDAIPLQDSERLPLNATLGRILAEPLVSTLDVPPWDNSAMDGYAVRAADLVGPAPRLPISQRLTAGKIGEPLTPGTAARIFTGAPLPPGADTVVIQEVCETDGDLVIIRTPPQSGAHVRQAGEDIRRGSEVIAKGTRLQPQHLGLAASIGAAELLTWRRLRVAILCTGDELMPPGQPLRPGCIYNSNQFLLTGLLERLGCEIQVLGPVADTLKATCEALDAGAAWGDLVLGSGGVSVGEEDHVKPALERLGELKLWKIAIRPGKPLAFGRLRDVPFLGLPGNPVSLFVTFCLIVRPFILRQQGITGPLTPHGYSLIADFDWPQPDWRREFVRARRVRGDDDVERAVLHPSRSSAVLSSVTWADGLVEIDHGQVLRRGDTVRFLPMEELIG